MYVLCVLGEGSCKKSPRDIQKCTGFLMGVSTVYTRRRGESESLPQPPYITIIGSGFCLAQYPRPACTALLNATTFLGLYMPWQKMVRRGRLGHVGVTIAKLRHVPDDHLQSQASRYTLSVSVASSRSQSAPIAPLQIYIPGTALAEEVS